jgi:Xaa-Pro aminopeptidase
MTSMFSAPVFQSFDVETTPKTVAPRLRALRAALAAAGVDGFLIPRADAHRGESVPDSEARLAYVTSFTGSAGLAVVGPTKAALFIDSRYTLQAPAETDPRRVTVIEVAHPGPSPRIAEFLPKGGRLAYDPWLHTPSEIADLTARLGDRLTLVPTDNLVDRIWTDRPAPPTTPVEKLGHNRAGRDALDKLAALRADLKAEGVDAALLTVPESINWLFNIRARDVPQVPVMLAFALVPRTGMPTLYLNRAITPDLRVAVEGVAKLAPAARLPETLRSLAESGRRVLADPATAPMALIDALRSIRPSAVIEKRDPVLLPKSIKNEAELAGMREAHRLDGIALARFLCWFDAEAPKGQLDEIGAVAALEHFRRLESSCVDISFETISGAGPNGAIVHYRVNRDTNRVIAPGDLLLLDSGAQYHAGTTDITRTLATGPASDEEKDRFTRVLKGMIAISMARFPKGTHGGHVDILARQFLWADGVTYNHGTGHGVGAYLSVHEGPINISPRSTTPFEAGMVVSNEPGYYKPGAYGIRIENLITVIPSQHAGYLEFETLTLAPIDTRLVTLALLTDAERAWLNAYHARVLAEIGPSVEPAVRDWLKRATAAI